MGWILSFVVTILGCAVALEIFWRGQLDRFAGPGLPRLDLYAAMRLLDYSRVRHEHVAPEEAVGVVL